MTGVCSFELREKDQSTVELEGHLFDELEYRKKRKCRWQNRESEDVKST